MAKPVAVDDATFEKTVLKATRPVLVDFWATWCKPCVAMAPIIDDLASEYGEKVSFLKMDIQANPKTPASYGIKGIPAVIIFKNGKPVSQTSGLRPKAELKKNIEGALSK